MTDPAQRAESVKIRTTKWNPYKTGFSLPFHDTWLCALVLRGEAAQLHLWLLGPVELDDVPPQVTEDAVDKKPDGCEEKARHQNRIHLQITLTEHTHRTRSQNWKPLKS